MKVIIESTNQVIKVFSAVGNGESGKYALLAEEAAVRAELAETGAENAENTAVNSANTATTQAGLSEAWAEGTEPGGVGTKSSREYSEDASGFATDAETEADSILNKIDLTGTFQVGEIARVQDVGGVLKFVRVKPALSFENIRHKLSTIAYPDDKLIFWDDFISPTGELNGRVAPSGQTWEVVNVTNLNPVLNEFSVTNNTALKTSGTLNIAALFPISSIRGIMLEGLFSCSSSSASAVNFVIFDNLNNWLKFTIGNDRTIIKSVSGVVTIISTSPNFLFPFDGSSNAKSVFKADLSIAYRGSTNGYPVSFGANGQNYNIVISDAEAITILDNAVKIGFGGYRGHSSYGIRLISGI